MQNNVVIREETGIFGLTSSYSIPYARLAKRTNARLAQVGENTHFVPAGVVP